MLEYVLARPFLYLFAINTVAYFSNTRMELTFVCASVFLILFIYFFRNNTPNCTLRLKFMTILCFHFFLFLVYSKVHHFSIQSERDQYIYETCYETQLLVQNTRRLQSKIAVRAYLLNGINKTGIEVFVPELSNLSGLTFGDTLHCSISIEPLKLSSNRLYNAYDRYLFFNHITHKGFCRDSNIQVIKSKYPTPLSIGQKLALKANTIFEQYCKDSLSLGILEGIVIGDKSNIGNDLKTVFQNAGLAHILAVSGMHLAILYSIIQCIFRAANRVNTMHSRFINETIILVILWLFTYTTGLSASAIRACLMISLHTSAKILSRKSDPVNTLFLTCYILQLHDPCIVEDIGFQLSVSAVLSILWYNPIMSQLISGIPFPLKYICEIFSISISVQALTLPFTLYYFHNFPLYFLLTNLIWVPLSSLVLSGGLALLLLHHIKPVAVLISCILQKCISFGTHIINHLSHFKSFALRDMWYDTQFIFLYLCCIISCWIGLRFQNHKFYYFTMILICLHPFLYYQNEVKIHQRNELLIYFERNKIQTGIRLGAEFYTTQMKTFLLRDYLNRNRIKKITPLSQDEILKLLPIKSLVKLCTKAPINHSRELDIYKICQTSSDSLLANNISTTLKYLTIKDKIQLMSEPIVIELP